MKKSRTPLEHVQHLIKKLSAEDRQKLIPFLGDLPDSGLQSFDLSEEIEYLKKHGTILASPKDNPDQFLVSLVFVRNHVLAEIYRTPILHATFFHDNFVQAFPKFKSQVELLSEAFQKVDKQRAIRRANLEEHGIHQKDELFA